MRKRRWWDGRVVEMEKMRAISASRDAIQGHEAWATGGIE